MTSVGRCAAVELREARSLRHTQMAQPTILAAGTDDGGDHIRLGDGIVLDIQTPSESRRTAMQRKLYLS